MFAVASNDPRSEVLRRLQAWDLTPAWLARRINESKQAVSLWLQGTSPRDPEMWDKMLEAIPSENPVVGAPLIPVGFQTAMLPMAGNVPCGDWGDPLASEEFIELDVKYEVIGKRYATRVVGDSCYPALQQGDIAVWHYDLNPAYGLIVLAQRKGDHFCTVKELTYDSEQKRNRLLPINPAHEEPDDMDGWGVIARLVAVVRNVDGMEASWYLPSGLRSRHLV